MPAEKRSNEFVANFDIEKKGDADNGTIPGFGSLAFPEFSEERRAVYSSHIC